MKAQTSRTVYNQHRVDGLKVLPSDRLRVRVKQDEIERVVDPAHLNPLMHVLRDHSGFQFKVRTDITAVDWPARAMRFDVVYQLLSVRFNTRVRVKTMCDERGVLPSMVPLYPAANWMEREVWDMFGIGFEGHPDLRRILTDYGFEGHPLRKDFPLTGYSEVRYDEAAKRVVYEPRERSQAFRAYEFRSPWKTMPTSPRLGRGGVAHPSSGSPSKPAS